MECSFTNFFIVHMPYNDGSIPKSIFCSALVGEFLKIAPSFFYTRLTWKSYGTAYENESAGAHIVPQVEKSIIQNHLKTFDIIQNHLTTFETIDMKLFLNFISK